MRQLLEAKAFEDVALGTLYKELDLSPAHAEVLFRRAYGAAPVAYRTRMRLRRARELLVSSQLNVSQTARAVGFRDPLYFSRLFRKAFGSTPSGLIRDLSNVRKRELQRGDA